MKVFDPRDLPPGDLDTDTLYSEQIETETGGRITKALLDDLASTGGGPPYRRLGNARLYHRGTFRL